MTWAVDRNDRVFLILRGALLSTEKSSDLDDGLDCRRFHTLHPNDFVQESEVGNFFVPIGQTFIISLDKSLFAANISQSKELLRELATIMEGHIEEYAEELDRRPVEEDDRRLAMQNVHINQRGKVSDRREDSEDPDDMFLH